MRDKALSKRAKP